MSDRLHGLWAIAVGLFDIYAMTRVLMRGDNPHVVLVACAVFLPIAGLALIVRAPHPTAAHVHRGRRVTTDRNRVEEEK